MLQVSVEVTLRLPTVLQGNKQEGPPLEVPQEV